MKKRIANRESRTGLPPNRNDTFGADYTPGRQERRRGDDSVTDLRKKLRKDGMFSNE